MVAEVAPLRVGFHVAIWSNPPRVGFEDVLKSLVADAMKGC
jgi:hypothetical protein